MEDYRLKALDMARKIIRREPEAQDDIEAVHLLEVELQAAFRAGKESASADASGQV